MPKKFTMEHKTRAFELYVQDVSVPKIPEYLLKEFGIVVHPQTVYLWLKNENWGEQKAKIKETALVAVSKGYASDITQATKEHLEAYRRMWRLGQEYLEHNPDFDKPIDAVRAVDIGVQGERKVMGGLVATKLIWDIVDIIRSEVHDEDVLQRISAKAAKLASTYTG